MLSMFHELRSFGTSYLGKDPHDQAADVLRSVLRFGAGELGFEACLTSRPFVLHFDANGCMKFGRHSDETDGGLRSDLLDGLSTLGHFGWTTVAIEGEKCRSDAVRRDMFVVAGPLDVRPELAPFASRVQSSRCSRFVVISDFSDDHYTCFDPLFGGYAVLDNEIVEQLPTVAIRAATTQPDRREIAEFVHRQGCKWSAGAPGARHESGSIDLSPRSAEALTRGVLRLRLCDSLQTLQRARLQWSRLLGYVQSGLQIDLLISDLLSDQITLACRALDVQSRRDLVALAETLGDIARLEMTLHEATAYRLEIDER